MEDSKAYGIMDGSPGEWWVPGSNLRIAGSLSRNAKVGRWELRLLGDLSPENEIARITGASADATLHGIGPLGPMTVFGAEITGGYRDFFDAPSPERKRRVHVGWSFREILIGGHFMPDAKWTSVRFELPGFVNWISGLGYTLEGDAALAGSVSAELPDTTVSAWWTDLDPGEFTTHRAGGYGGYIFSSTSGITLERIDKLIQALRNLNRVVNNSFASPVSFELRQSEDVAANRVHRLRARNIEYRESDFLTSYLSIRDIDFSTFIPRWIDIHESSPVWPTFGPHPESSGYIETEFVAAVNEAEALSKLFCTLKSSPSDREQAILEAVEEHLTAKQYDRVKRALEQSRNKLAPVLVSLLKAGAPAFHEDFLPKPEEWSLAVSQARHALSHGLDADNYPSAATNAQALMHLTTTVQVVKKLAALHAAGYEYIQPTESDPAFFRRMDTVRFRNNNSALGEEISLVTYASTIWTRPLEIGQ